MYIASFTTAYGRLKLYEILDEVQDRAIYCDTDSLVYLSRNEEECLPLSDLLGGLTNEVSEGYITEFCTTGPKSYAYKTSEGETVCKIKGFSLNYSNAAILNFESLRQMVFQKDLKVMVQNKNQIVRDKKDFSLCNRDIPKEHQFTFCQRKIDDNYMTYPYGF